MARYLKGSPWQFPAIERIIFGSILLNNGLFHRVRANLDRHVFAVKRHETIWSAIRQNFDDHGVTDPVLLRNELERIDELDNVGGSLYLVEVINAMTNADEAESLANHFGTTLQ